MTNYKEKLQSMSDAELIKEMLMRELNLVMHEAADRLGRMQWQPIKT